MWKRTCSTGFECRLFTGCGKLRSFSPFSWSVYGGNGGNLTSARLTTKIFFFGGGDPRGRRVSYIPGEKLSSRPLISRKNKPLLLPQWYRQPHICRAKISRFEIAPCPPGTGPSGPNPGSPLRRTDEPLFGRNVTNLGPSDQR